MDRSEIIEATADFVRDQLAGDSSGHDRWHIERVRRQALTLGRQVDADLFVVELAALLHDIADWKFHDGDLTAGPRQAGKWLESCGVERQVIAEVGEIIATLSFKGAGVPTPMASVEGQVVQDADRLDALGAIGIARAFAYGGHRERAMHDPEVAPELHSSVEAYSRSEGTTINHFHEKLLLLAERMNTEPARRLAAERQAYMESFLERFAAEWDGRS
jgi:uncharacterized protein